MAVSALIFFFRLGNHVVERVKRIKPSFSAWEADILPLNYNRGPGSYVLYLTG
jgi:hypothetical protein